MYIYMYYMYNNTDNNNEVGRGPLQGPRQTLFAYDYDCRDRNPVYELSHRVPHWIYCHPQFDAWLLDGGDPPSDNRPPMV